MNNFYDFIVIGAGISGCTFASSLNKRLSDASILLIEHGRRIGGRATTRKSRKNQVLEFDHGLPSISLSNQTSKDILKLIYPLINSKKLVDISNDILFMNELGFFNKSYIHEKVYRGFPFMINFCEEIINQSINPSKINFLFQTLIKSIKRVNDLWEIKGNNGRLIKSKTLILSSSLIAHPRCLKILETNSLPLRDAFILGKDEVVDSVLRDTKKLTYIKRKIFIFLVSNLNLVQKFNHKYLQIVFTKVIREYLNLERIVFQGQPDRSMIIILHCSYLNNPPAIDFEYIHQSLISLFVNDRIFLDMFFHARLLDEMHWRASQPLNHLLSKELQWSSSSKIGFCGDWFDFNNCGRVESAMKSSIRLTKLIN